MIFDALFLAFTLGSEKAKEQSAAMEAKRMMQDETAQRNKFFAEQRKWGEDKFFVFGKPGDRSYYGDSLSGIFKEYRSPEILKMLDLIDEGFWPVPKVFKSPISSEVLQKSKLEGFQYKVVQKGDYAELYLRLSEVENYIVHRNSSGNYYKRSMYEEIPQEVRELFYAGKTTIGIPFGQVGSVPCQAMTTQEAREFMERTMEERFQEYWKSMRK